MGTFGRSRYEKRGDFQKENGEMQTLFWKDLKESGESFDEWRDDCPGSVLNRPRSRKDRKFIILCREFMRAFG